MTNYIRSITMERIQPEIKAIDLKKNKYDTWKFLNIFTSKYKEIISKNPNNIEIFNTSQNVLLTFDYIYYVVDHGGFTQLIYQGDLEYIFSESFYKTIKFWGASKFASIIENVKKLYEKNKIEYDKNKLLDGFPEDYKEISDFGSIEKEYFEVIKNETIIIKKYVEENLCKFGNII